MKGKTKVSSFILFKIGDRVEHPRWGFGNVVGVENVREVEIHPNRHPQRVVVNYSGVEKKGSGHFLTKIKKK